MARILEGVRILEVAEHTFVPAASAVLSDLGAEVIKIEHVTRGDAMRGLASSGIALVPGKVHAVLEHSNRGKKSLGLDLTSSDGLEIPYKLAATSDVFLTNKLPSVRERLKIDVESIRTANPRIIYVRGTGQGERGPEADKGSYDSLAFWARAGVAVGAGSCAGVQRARRPDPRRARPRLGCDPRPQGPRRRRLTPSSQHQEISPCRSSMHSDSTASTCSSSAAPPGWAPRPPSWPWTRVPRSS